jgi:hypothetical protein
MRTKGTPTNTTALCRKRTLVMKLSEGVTSGMSMSRFDAAKRKDRGLSALLPSYCPSFATRSVSLAWEGGRDPGE